MKELAPCPSCGSADVRLAVRVPNYYVRCYSCYVNGPLDSFSKDNAMLRWNNMPRKAAPAEAVVAVLINDALDELATSEPRLSTVRAILNRALQYVPPESQPVKIDVRSKGIELLRAALKRAEE